MGVQAVGLPGFLGHIVKVGIEAKRLDETIVTGLAVEAKATVLSVAGAEIPGRKLSRFANGKGIELKARFVVKTGETPTAILYPTPPGPWYLLEGGGIEHQIGRRGTKRGARRNQPGFLGRSGSGFAAIGPVTHPEAKPRYTWSTASAVAIARSGRSFGHQSRQAYLKMFAG